MCRQRVQGWHLQMQRVCAWSCTVGKGARGDRARQSAFAWTLCIALRYAGVCMVHLGLCASVGAHMDEFTQVYTCAWAAPCGNRE